MGLSNEKERLISPVEFYLKIKGGGKHVTKVSLAPRTDFSNKIFFDFAKFKIAILDIRICITGWKPIPNSDESIPIWSNTMNRDEFFAGREFVVRSRRDGVILKGNYTTIEPYLKSCYCQYANEIIFHMPTKGNPEAIGSLKLSGSQVWAFNSSNFTNDSLMTHWLVITGFTEQTTKGQTYWVPDFGLHPEVFSADVRERRDRLQGDWDEYIGKLLDQEDVTNSMVEGSILPGHARPVQQPQPQPQQVQVQPQPQVQPVQIEAPLQRAPVASAAVPEGQYVRPIENPLQGVPKRQSYEHPPVYPSQVQPQSPQQAHQVQPQPQQVQPKPQPVVNPGPIAPEDVPEGVEATKPDEDDLPF